MKSRPIVYLISLVHKSTYFEQFVVNLQPYQRRRFLFLLLNPGPSHFEAFLRQYKIPLIRINYKNKWSMFPSFFLVIYHLIKIRPRIIHAHLFEAQLIGLLCGYLVRTEVRIYTRHNSNFHQAYHPKSVWLDLLCNRLATKVVSISQATDFTLLKLENLPPYKLVKIPHGFDFQLIDKVTEESVQRIRGKWNISGSPIIGIVARQIEWKGIQYIIPAFDQFRRQYPNALLILANAKGPYRNEILKLLAKLPFGSYLEIEFEENILALYRLFDIYIHTPVDPICEAFGQTYIEALAMGIPSIFTPSGIAGEFIRHQYNAWVPNFRDSNTIFEGLIKLWSNKELRLNMADNGFNSVRNQFDIILNVERLMKLYHDNYLE